MKSKLAKPKRIYYQYFMDVIDINTLPKDQIKPFRKWMNGQTQPMFVEFPKTDFAYFDDYRNWYGGWIQNKVTEVFD